MPVNGRLAPTPSGYLHIGNAFNFLLTDYITQHQHGTLRLRIDDMDTNRVSDVYLTDIFETLHWLGIPWELGPKHLDDHRLHYSQTLRRALYEEYIQQLQRTGLVYACVCSRTSIKQFEGCTCSRKKLAPDTTESALRISTDQVTITFEDELANRCSINLHEVMPDFVIRRKDGLPAYQIVSLVDDQEYATSIIVRGQDLLASTAAQIWLSELLGIKSFTSTQKYHHPLITGSDQQKLSKAAGDQSLYHLRKTHHDSSFLYQQLSFCFGLHAVSNRTDLHEQLDKQGGVAFLKTHFNHSSFQLPDNR